MTTRRHHSKFYVKVLALSRPCQSKARIYQNWISLQFHYLETWKSRIMQITKLAVLTFAVLCVNERTLLAESITVSNLGTDDIVVPVFDTNLGTLDSVNLTITLRAGTTNIGGAHEPATYNLFSSNTRGNPFVSGFSTFQMTMSVVSNDVHTVVTPSYSDGGVDVGGFTFSTTPSGSHAHQATIFYNGLQQVGPSSWAARAVVDPLPTSGHSATYDSQSKNLSYSGMDLVPFLGPSDIIINAGTFGTTSVGNHSHVLSGFTRLVDSNTGPWTWNFNTSVTPSTGAHQLTLDPTFDTVATSNFTPPPASVTVVPEPSSLALFGLGAIGMALVAARRRREKQTTAA